MSRKKPFEHVVAEHGDRVLGICRVILSRQDAEDAWAETFISALRAYPSLPADANVEAWLTTIAQRKALDSLRAARRRPLPSDELPEQASPEEIGIDGQPELWEAVRALPDRQRQAIAYHFLGGLPYAEVAELLGGSAAAARRAAADGIRRLRRHYGVGAAKEGAP